MRFYNNNLLYLLGILLLFGAGTVFGQDFQTVTDARGHTVQIKRDIKRIVVLNRSALEVIRILGAQDLVVGVSDSVKDDPVFFREFQDRPLVGRWMEPNYEKIVSLKPDVCLAYALFPGPELEKNLKIAGIPVLRIDLYKMSSFEREIRVLGNILGKNEPALNFLKWYEQQLGLIKKLVKMEKARGQRPPRVYSESYSPYKTEGPGSGSYQLIVLAGGEPISSTMSLEFADVTPEWILAGQPEVIIKKVPKMGYSQDNPAFLDRIKMDLVNRPGFGAIRAVKNGRVYCMASDISSGPGKIVGLAYLSTWFYPDIARFIDPEVIHREYLERFQHMPYRGVYVSSPGKLL
ncbi:MAG: ABC transporter substrate-binding protein [Dissulfurimicrobium sp.]|uniref:ABC transporter substrate-binding protein n=1 Tax=Dissulfurimicrobium sp. TaxID=2022436 RepID=UPI00404A300B